MATKSKKAAPAEKAPSGAYCGLCYRESCPAALHKKAPPDDAAPKTHFNYAMAQHDCWLAREAGERKDVETDMTLLEAHAAATKQAAKVLDCEPTPPMVLYSIRETMELASRLAEEMNAARADLARLRRSAINWHQIAIPKPFSDEKPDTNRPTNPKQLVLLSLLNDTVIVGTYANRQHHDGSTYGMWRDIYGVKAEGVVAWAVMPPGVQIVKGQRAAASQHSTPASAVKKVRPIGLASVEAEA